MAKRERWWRFYSYEGHGTKIVIDHEGGPYFMIPIGSDMPTVKDTDRIARRICRAVNKVEGRGGAKHGKA